MTIEVWVGQCRHCPFFRMRTSSCRWTGERTSPELLVDGPPPISCKLRATDYRVLISPVVAEWEKIN